MSKDAALEQYTATEWEAVMSTSSELPWQKTEQWASPLARVEPASNSDDSSHRRHMGLRFPNYYSHL